MNRVKKTLSLAIIVSLPYFVFSQGLELADIENGNFGRSISDMFFTSADTGYISTCIFEGEEDGTIYCRSVDSGKNWYRFDTTLNFSVQVMEYAFNKGVICINEGEVAAIEVFEENFLERTRYSFPELKSFHQISILSSDTIVFFGEDNMSKFFIGVISFNEGTPEITEQNEVEADVYSKICSFTTSSIWLLFDGDLKHTENIGQSWASSAQSVVGFDFYNIDQGAYFTYSGVYTTNNRGADWSYLSVLNIPSPSSIAFTSPNEIWVAGALIGNNGQAYFKLFDTNYGSNNPVKEIFSEEIYSDFNIEIYKYNENQIYFRDTYESYLYYTLNNCNYTDIEQNYESQNEMSLFPNPANSYITIDFEDSNIATDTKVRIIDLLGNIVFENSYSEQSDITIDVSQFSDGLYTVSISTDSGQKNLKLIKIQA